MDVIWSIAIVLFIGGVYFIVSDGSPGRTKRLTRFLDDLSDYQLKQICHNSISILWGIVILLTAGAVLLAGYSLSSENYVILFITFVAWMVMLFGSSYYIKRFVINGNHFRIK